MFIKKRKRNGNDEKRNVLTVATMLFSMAVSATFVSAAEVYPKEYNTEGTITFEAGDEGNNSSC